MTRTGGGPSDTKNWSQSNPSDDGDQIAGERALVRVTRVRIMRPYVLDLTFSDGTRGEVDVESDLWGEVFAPLKDPKYFARGRLDREAGTVVWPNGADFAPEYLHEQAVAAASRA